MELVVAGDRRRSRNGDRLDSVNAEASSSNERSERKEETLAELPSWSERRGGDGGRRGGDGRRRRLSGSAREREREGEKEK
jgi:hypothetical protein